MLFDLVEGRDPKLRHAQPAGLAHQRLKRRDLALVLRIAEPHGGAAEPPRLGLVCQRLGEGVAQSVEMGVPAAARQLVETQRNGSALLGKGLGDEAERPVVEELGARSQFVPGELHQHALMAAQVAF